MKWINIKDQLPPALEDILIYGTNICADCDKEAKNRVWCGYMQNNNVFLTLETRCVILPEYWMYLPSFPDIPEEDFKFWKDDDPHDKRICPCSKCGNCENDEDCPPISPKEFKDILDSISGINDELLSEDFKRNRDTKEIVKHEVD